MENYSKSVGVVVIRDNKVLLGRHTYGAGKGKLIIPGGFIHDEELPEQTAVRETLEETGVLVRPVDVVGIRFQPWNWYVVMRADFLEQVTDEHDDENSEIVWMDIEEAMERSDVPNLTKSCVRAAVNGETLTWKTGDCPAEKEPYTFYSRY